jgi:hypothetical protein
LSGLPLETIRALQPLFDELEEVEEGINCDEFMEAMDRLYRVSRFMSNSFIGAGPCVKGTRAKHFQEANYRSRSTLAIWKE